MISVQAAVDDMRTDIQGKAEPRTDSMTSRSQKAEDQKKELIKWLSPLHYNVRQEISNRLRKKGTGEWMFDKKALELWEEVNGMCLWVNGIAGSGKTILASNAIDRVQRTIHKYPGHILAYAYCEFGDATTTDSVNIIRTLLAQLLNEWSSDSPEKFEDLFQKMDKSQAPPTGISELTDLVLRACKDTERAIIIIDALDESTGREGLLDFVVRVSEEPNINILVTSRKEQDIVEVLSSYPTISLTDESHNLVNDMRAHIIQELNGAKR